MFDVEKIDVTMSTIAVLAVTPEQPMSISQKELEDVLRRPVSVVQSPAALVVSSQRDQIEAILSGNKTNIRDLSGRKDFSESKVPTILHFFIQRLPSRITSYGLNFVMSVPCAKPARWISDNILSPQITEKTGKTLVGGAGTLKLEVGSKTWNVKFDPGDNEVISVDFNASEQTEELPEPNRLREELQEQFDELLEFLDSLEL